MNSADDDRIAARRAEAIRLRVRGKTIREIAAELNIGVATAHDDVRHQMRETARVAEEDVQAQRGLDLGRLERALEVVSEVLLSPEPTGAEGGKDTMDAIESSRELKLKALDRLVKIQEQRAKLLGLYAPEKRELNATVTAVSLEDIDALRRTAESNECPQDSGKSSEGEPSS
jgi:hypothetical protein